MATIQHRFCQAMADTLKGPPPDGISQEKKKTYIDGAVLAAAVIEVFYLYDRDDALEGANVARTAILQRADLIQQVKLEAASNGFILPDDPFPAFSQLNFLRSIFEPLSITDEQAAVLYETSISLSKVAKAREDGTVSFVRGSDPTHHITHFELSVDGFSGGSADALSAILGYQPDADELKRQRAQEALSRLDFSLRRPRPLFVADRIVDNRRTGAVLCWRKMRDAAGYTVARRDVFVDETKATHLPARDSQERTDELLADPTVLQLLTFYGDLHPSDVVLFHDDSTVPDRVYSYVVSAYQNKAPISRNLFDVPVSQLYLSQAQVQQVRESILADADGKGIDTISPYPALAQAAFGDSRHDWILAGSNVLASVRRGDGSEGTRRFSYLGARATDILDAVSAGLLVVPTDIVSIQEAVVGSLSAWGVSQTILAVLDGTGTTLYVAGDDSVGFQATAVAVDASTDGLYRILSAIDPEMAVIDPQNIIANLSVPSRDPFDTVHRPRETPVRGGGTVGTPDVVPSIPTVSDIGTELIDLTTYEGISRLIRTIRFFYDFFPTRV